MMAFSTRISGDFRQVGINHNLIGVQSSRDGHSKIMKYVDNIMVVGDSCRPKIARSCSMRPRAKRHDSTGVNSTLTSRATGRLLS